MKSILIAGAAWGEHYVTMLLDYCLPSMLASLPDLSKEREVIISIRTDEQLRVSHAEIIKKILSLGIKVFIESCEETATNNDKYYALSRVQNIDIKYAREIGADYHLLMPDNIYSENHFKSLMAAVNRGHKAIVKLCPSTVMETILPEIEPYRDGDTIRIPPGDLTAIALKNLHFRSEAWSTADGYPNIHIAMWEGKDSFHIIASHQTALYLDHSKEDGLVLIEVTRAHTITGDLSRAIGQEEWCKLFWASLDSRNPKFADLMNVDPINRALLDLPYRPEEEVLGIEKQLKEALRINRD